jgi:hypothetical protein
MMYSLLPKETAALAAQQKLPRSTQAGRVEHLLRYKTALLGKQIAAGGYDSLLDEGPADGNPPDTFRLLGRCLGATLRREFSALHNHRRRELLRDPVPAAPAPADRADRTTDPVEPAAPT